MFDSFQELRTVCLSCTKCELAATRTNVAFGVGSEEAKILFVGEGPGENEDLQGEPFVGRAGILLDKMLKAVHLSRKKNIYIANIVKCRPPNNRDPRPEEQLACIGYLENQIALLKPKILVCLGRIAAQKIIGEDFKISREHGRWFQQDDMLLMGMFHPAYLLRNAASKPDAFRDFLILRDKALEICPEVYAGLPPEEAPVE